MPKLIFLHGFLGDKQDWEGVMAHLPDFECLALSYPFEIPSDGILVGYSMGGRVACKYPHPKILISSHPGLKTEEEKDERRRWEQKWRYLLQTDSFDHFLQLWYDQPLFECLKKSSNFPAIFARRMAGSKEVALHQFESLLLSSYSYHLPANAHFLCGSDDKKYLDLYTRLCLNPLIIQGSSHACHLEQPTQCASVIRQILEKSPNDT